MPAYAHVLPDPGRAFSQLFTYRVPDHLRRQVRVGVQVLVPFGSRTVVGLVAELVAEPGRDELKDIEAVLEDVPALAGDALPLARWMADYYLCELGDALRPFLAEGMNYRVGRRFRLLDGDIPDSIAQHADASAVLQELAAADSYVSLGALRRVVPAPRLQRALRLLKSRGLIEERATMIPPRARERQIRLLEISASPEQIERYCKERCSRAPARVAALRARLGTGPIQASELAACAGVSTAAVNGLIKDGLLRAHWTPVRRKPWESTQAARTEPPELTPEQAQAVGAIIESIEAARPDSFLLFGVTASGKTEVFLRALQRVLDRGKQALVLLPEISLSAQAVGIYRARFGDRVAILHSALSVGERWDEWQRIRTGEAAIVVGARSALFAPVRSLGLIVVDEEHESSYKQEQTPRYHARDVALKRAELNGCPVVLASATPSLESYFEAERGQHKLLRLSARIDERPLPRVQLVDMRGRSRKAAILSTALRQAIAACLQRDEQVILFLNRRGFATFMLCPTCGEAVRCPDCGVSLKYYAESRRVRCHHCNRDERAPDLCAKCGSPQMRFSGFGTERVERELRRLFPTARVGRLDRDTTGRKGSHVQIVGQFHKTETNVLVGTQMVAKGFDFPNVTLVGVISADTSLGLPDFRAAERTFQLLTQVSGRAGRRDKPGEVVVQTYRPNDYSIEAASRHDYEGFYQREIEARRELNYPPFARLVNIVVSAHEEKDAIARANALAQALESASSDLSVQVLGPAPAPLQRLRGRYRWHVIVKGATGTIQAVVREALARVGEPGPVTCQVDVDPVSLM
ncbi:MAG: primosomal protein N' [Armatimonadetes bacterium]|nr:primosomal protein N' [Armatimonadota bacterium]